MKKTPGAATPSQAVAVFLAAFCVIIGIGIFFARTGLPLEVAVLAVPGATLLVALGAIRMFRLDPFRTFRLRPARNAHLLLALPVALSLFVVSDQLANLSRSLLPLDEGILEAAAEMVRADGWLSWMIRLAGVGFGAAVSEELLFRGVILSGLQRLGRLPAIIVSAVMFTALHGLLLPNYFVAGLVLGLAATATRSILVPIAIHFFHNLAALLLFNLAEVETLGDPLWTPAGILIPAGAILCLGMFAWLRNPRPATAPSPPAVWRLPAPPPQSLHLARDLKGIPPRRRALGYGFLAVSMAGGVFLVSGLFGYLGYVANPAPQRQAVIEWLHQTARGALTPEADARSTEVEAAFETLLELNRQGRLDLWQVWTTARTVRGATRDGSFDESDVEALLMAVGAIRQQRAPAGPAPPAAPPPFPGFSAPPSS